MLGLFSEFNPFTSHIPIRYILYLSGIYSLPHQGTFHKTFPEM